MRAGHGTTHPTARPGDTRRVSPHPFSGATRTSSSTASRSEAAVPCPVLHAFGDTVATRDTVNGLRNEKADRMMIAAEIFHVEPWNDVRKWQDRQTLRSKPR